MSDSSTRRAFTLAELLVVVSIIAILVAVSMASFKAAFVGAKSTTSTSNMRQLGAALLLYAKDADGFLPPYANSERVIGLAEQRFGACRPLPTSSHKPELLKAAVMPYIKDENVWFTDMDPARRTEAYFLGIRHSVSSYVFVTIDLHGLIDRLREGGFPYGIMPAIRPEDMTAPMLGDPSAPGDLSENDVNHTWDSGEMRSYYPSGAVHAVYSDLHLFVTNCNQRPAKRRESR
jgi:prepilin-type N-terminal cleavage/methylation domain-containing protein